MLQRSIWVSAAVESVELSTPGRTRVTRLLPSWGRTRGGIDQTRSPGRCGANALVAGAGGVRWMSVPSHDRSVGGCWFGPNACGAVEAGPRSAAAVPALRPLAGAPAAFAPRLPSVVAS